MKSFVVLILAAAMALASLVCTAAPGDDEPRIFATRSGAIRGYDPVAYFTNEAPHKGNRELSYRWNDADWYFSSEENRALFMDDPEKYAPQYGGYCAFAMSKGYHAKTEADAWTVYEGKLYLNYSKSVRKTWLQDIPLYVKRADRNWAAFQGEPSG